ncbi:G patch domain-containing protein 1 homolog [Plodia interpunctella]|uniref:G patch domain-containing protein 1 homolog n=1 Tax=Plodia interpunctella TaxID=58824 RepID=UPI0023678D6E|nr:G patch domain-containing protein 1 homolog [Plodia interpunctella]
MSDSGSDDENTIRYGTPLEPYEEDEIPSKRKYQQQTDQYAVDAHGRRRFHGAFTGGFSAGFGNSVGTPEGWTPATFKSSRGDKAQVSSQRPEDFMDEEDRSEFGIAPRHMQTHSEFSGQKRLRQQRYHDGPIPGEPVLEQLVRAVHETAAVRMLRAMGWRPGQGTGDRVTREEKKRDKQRHKVYGCYMPKDVRENQQQSSEDSDSDYDIEALFAPDDYEPYILSRKVDRFGLGYSGLSRHSVLGNLIGEYNAGSSKSHLVMKDKGKKVSIRGQAFGVGAFEAEDEDIYATEDMTHYDFELGGPSKEKKKKPIKQGVNVLEGFVKAVKPPPPPAAHAPPPPPREFVAAARRTRFQPSDVPQRDQGLGRHELSAEARGALLGETPLKLHPTPIVPPSSETPKTDPIAQLLGRNVNFVSNAEKEGERELNFISIKDSGKEINKVFRPFMSNPKKQARYELFLRDKEAYMREGDSDVDRLLEWEREREIVEFEQAAKLYKPLTGIMNDRFTHASQPDDSTNPLIAVAKSSNNYGLASKEMVEAASRGVYGVMTRREADWRPDPLVSKRFNVPEIGGNRSEQKKEDKPKVSYSVFSYLESSVHDKDSFAKEQTQFSGSKSINVEPKTIQKVPQVKNVNENNEKGKVVASTSVSDTSFNKRMTVADLFLKESEKDLNNKEKGTEVTETIEKFDKMDLYKSIFLSDSEDEEVPYKSGEKSDTIDFIEKPKNVERNTSPPRGIFANIDFDEINSWKRNTDNKKPDDAKDPVSVASTEDSVNIEKPSAESEEYGPKIPENLKKRLEESCVFTDNFRPMFRSKNEKQTDPIDVDSSSADSWVEAKDAKSKKQKKKKSKKHKHKKSKHKKKDR